jgi:hypothetical protein
VLRGYLVSTTVGACVLLELLEISRVSSTLRQRERRATSYKLRGVLTLEVKVMGKSGEGAGGDVAIKNSLFTSFRKYRRTRYKEDY